MESNKTPDKTHHLSGDNNVDKGTAHADDPHFQFATGSYGKADIARSDRANALNKWTKHDTRGEKLQLPAITLEWQGHSSVTDTEARSSKVPEQRRLTSVLEVKIENFQKVAEQLFARIDKDGNGFLSKSELAASVQDGQFKGQEAQVVAALYHNVNELAKLSNDEWGPEWSGISKSDLAVFGNNYRKRVKEYALADAAKTWAEKPENFKRVDTDGNGFLSRGEIAKALADKNLSVSDRNVLKYIFKNIDTIQATSNEEWGPEIGGIRLKDLQAHCGNMCPDDQLVKAISENISLTHRSQNTGTCMDLYDISSEPLESIKPDAIKQGSIGDCYLLASLASVASSNPATIQKMIKDNGNDTYTVTFPGAPKEPITVKAPTEAELGLYNGGGKYGIWPSVIEKAAGEYCQQHFWRRSPFNLSGGITPAEGVDGGSWSNVWALKMLTGKSAQEASLSFDSTSTIRQKLMKSFSSKPPEVVTAKTINSVSKFIGGSNESVDGFRCAHAYSILGFDPEGTDGGTLTIRDPWGDPETGPHGTMQISLQQFKDNFNYLIYTF